MVLIFLLQVMAVGKTPKAKSYKDRRHKIMNYTGEIELSWYNDPETVRDAKGNKISSKVYVYINTKGKIELWCNDKIKLITSYIIRPYGNNPYKVWNMKRWGEVEQLFHNWYSKRGEKLSKDWLRKNRVYVTTIKKDDKYLKGKKGALSTETSKIYAGHPSKVLKYANPTIEKVIAKNKKLWNKHVEKMKNRKKKK